MRKTLLLVAVLWVSLFIFSRTQSGNANEDLSIDGKQEMLQVLQRVLEQLQQRRTSSWMMRNHSRIPRCSVGDVCVLKKGSRVGQLCECPQSSRCSMFFHKCLPTGF